MIIHVVKQGDSLYTIAKQYNADYLKIAAENEIPPDQSLVIGQTIVITGAGYTRKFGNIEVNGYAFPEISMEVLNKTLPNLTYLSIFSYNLLANGSLEQINDSPLIAACRSFGVSPVMVITNISGDSGFDSDLASAILNSPALQDKLIAELIRIMKTKGYDGLDVDFEYIYPKDRIAYNNFLTKIRTALKENNFFLTTALAPKISADQPGLLYEAHDYKFHGTIADHVILMTYE